MKQFLLILLLSIGFGSLTTATAQLSADHTELIKHHKTWRAVNSVTGIGITAGAIAIIPLEPISALAIPIGAAFLNRAGMNNLFIYQLRLEEKIALASSQEMKDFYLGELQRRYNRAANLKLLTGYGLGGIGLTGIGAGAYIVTTATDGWAQLGGMVFIYAGVIAALSGVPFIVSGHRLKNRANLMLYTGELPSIGVIQNSSTRYLAMGLRIPVGR